ncbi:MAG TPA: S8 family serine peptidase, partial [Streptomyces sp.]|nr:S8 family serine peptidase [Streptomyces sp.]
MAMMRTLRTVSGATLAGALLFASAPHAAADQVRDDQWALNALQAKSVWQITKGKGQVIAVIDAGVDANHPDLRGSVLKGKDFMDGGSPAPQGGDDHGTSMAADIAGHGHGPGHENGVMGLAPEAKILPIRDLGQSSTGLAASIRFAVDHGATVINISLGGHDPARKAMEKAIGYAVSHDVVIVAPTGNSGGPVEYPAAFDGVVAVSGVAKDGTYWTDSSRGEETLLSAPAERIVSAGDSDSGYVIA